MKTILSLCLAAMLLSACGSQSDKGGTETNPTGINTSSVQPLKNPAHGMPGHDCAIPEGAPLPQKGPAKPELQNIAPEVKTEVQDLPVETNKAAIKLNPAHGMPGHRCELAVGAPLN